MSGRKGIELDTHFWSKVKQLGPYDCWPWLEVKNDKGYGYFRVGKRKVLAHRYAYVHRYKEYITPDDLICHHCDNPSCCNPNHLFKGTVKDNNDDKINKGRHAYKTHPKFYEGEVFLMRKLYTAGIRIVRIAKMFRIHRAQMHRLLNNLTYTPKEMVS